MTATLNGILLCIDFFVIVHLTAYIGGGEHVCVCALLTKFYIVPHLAKRSSASWVFIYLFIKVQIIVIVLI